MSDDDEEQLRRGLTQAVAQFGALQGVIHAADADTEQSFAMISGFDQAHCQALFRPKLADRWPWQTCYRTGRRIFAWWCPRSRRSWAGWVAAAYTAATSSWMPSHTSRTRLAAHPGLASTGIFGNCRNKRARRSAGSRRSSSPSRLLRVARPFAGLWRRVRSIRWLFRPAIWRRASSSGSRANR